MTQCKSNAGDLRSRKNKNKMGMKQTAWLTFYSTMYDMSLRRRDEEKRSPVHITHDFTLWVIHSLLEKPNFEKGGEKSQDE